MVTEDKVLATFPLAPEFKPFITKAPLRFSQDKTILKPLIADIGKYFSAQPPNREEMSWKV